VTAETKKTVTTWLPLAVSVFTNAAMLAYGYGVLAQRVEAAYGHIKDPQAHIRQEAIYKEFVTRSEYATSQAISAERYNADMDRIEAYLLRLENKIDRLAERKD